MKIKNYEPFGRDGKIVRIEFEDLGISDEDLNKIYEDKELYEKMKNKGLRNRSIWPWTLLIMNENIYPYAPAFFINLKGGFVELYSSHLGLAQKIFACISGGGDLNQMCLNYLRSGRTQVQT